MNQGSGKFLTGKVPDRLKRPQSFGSRNGAIYPLNQLENYHYLSQGSG